MSLIARVARVAIPRLSRAATVGLLRAHSATVCRATSNSIITHQSCRTFSTTPASPTTSPFDTKYEYVLVEKKGDASNVALVTLNRPKALNALCDGLVNELNSVVKALDKDPSIGAIVLTGSEKAFAAGADIKEMANKTYMEAYRTDMLAHWHDITKVKKPIIAAVNGYALGGGCELAMMCDIILAGDKARFGQPEVCIGTIPGCGGSQRLTRAIGKSKAMEMILTGNQMKAEEAEKAGLVSRVVPAAELVPQAITLASQIASYSKPIVAMCKDVVNAAYETTLEQGVIFERRQFHASFATSDQKEGMSSFAAKKKPTWSDS